MKKFRILLMIVLGLGFVFQSCNNGKTYAEMKEEEREAIKRFIEVNDIKVIDEDQFEAQDSTTNVAANEYVLFEESGVYMQVIERGNGELLEDGRHEILARYVEEQIVEDGTTDTLSLNTIANLYAHPDEFILTKQDNSLSASFSTSGAMYATHGSAYVPTGWLLPLNYLKVGREISGRSKIKLILPHSEGTSTASGQVIPCYYEITYQLSR
ncbi:MAG: DUF4827 domain-containing protein [Bacteroides sp.]|nr:DUF4827 domain-containing protein [Bacteroides sp.]